MTDYMGVYGERVANNGYRIVPIRKGSKAPLGLDWTENAIDASNIEAVLSDGYTHGHWVDKKTKTRGTRTWKVQANGIGVLCAETPGVDIDCQDESVAAHMLAFTEDLLGKTICRVGLAPKSLLLYRTERPFGKINSSTFLDGAGRRAKLEVLGTGQQFVALAIHPDTGKPYKWRDKQGVHNTPLAHLPAITVEQARQIKDEFERIARERNWDVVSENRSLTTGVVDPDDVFAEDAQRVVGMPDTEFRRLLMLVPVGDYDFWLQVGMALFHQYDGSDEGLELWDDWSESSKDYDRAEIESKWPTFDIGGKHRQPITARLILDRAYAIEKEQAEEMVGDAVEAFLLAKTPTDLQRVAAKYKTVAFSAADRVQLVGELRTAYKKLTNNLLPVDQAKKMLTYEDVNRADKYDWCRDWVYVQDEMTFGHVVSNLTLTPRAFDATFSRSLLTRMDIAEGKTKPDSLPQDVALNVVQIPVVFSRGYMPSMPPLYNINGRDFLNSYTERGVPSMPGKPTPEGRRAIGIVERHSAHLIENERDRRLFLDALAYIVQTKDRLNWGIFLQGAEGDGKTFWGSLMAAVLGMENAPIIRGTELQEKYTSWAERGLFVTIEEVRLTGEHRYDAVNNLKPYIGNARVPIRKMNTDTYEVINCSSYLLTSNFKDGLPAGEGRRYFVLFSRWQRDADMAEFVRDNPDYYADLYGTLNEAGALRKWLMGRVLSDEIDPKGRAPVSSSMFEMKAISTDDETSELNDVLETADENDFSRTLLDSGKLDEHLTNCPNGKRLAQMLNKNGLTYLGETGFGGKTRRWWSSKPGLFQKIDVDGRSKIDTEKVKNWVETTL